MLTVFLPCRKGSQRIPDKNVRNFAGVNGGLLAIKINQLIRVSSIDKIVVSSNDERVLDYVSQLTDSRIITDERPEKLGNSNTTTDELIQYVPGIICSGHILWTHVTSPFVNESDYQKAINIYFDCLKDGFDSLMTVQKLQGFIWNDNSPVSYERTELKWPMTQNIRPLYEVDSGIFISHANNYQKLGDRIGLNPFLLVQDKLKSIDIDWPEDYEFAEKIWGYQTGQSQLKA